MTAYDRDEESFFLMDLMTGERRRFPELAQGLNFYRFEQDYYTAQALDAVTKNMRKKLKFILQACKSWKARHGELMSEVERRYSAYEGMLCFQDLRQHWMLYRRAMKEMCYAQETFHQKLFAAQRYKRAA